jgi:hypothetical protein
VFGLPTQNAHFLRNNGLRFPAGSGMIYRRLVFRFHPWRGEIIRVCVGGRFLLGAALTFCGYISSDSTAQLPLCITLPGIKALANTVLPSAVPKNGETYPEVAELHS